MAMLLDFEKNKFLSPSTFNQVSFGQILWPDGAIGTKIHHKYLLPKIIMNRVIKKFYILVKLLMRILKSDRSKKKWAARILNIQKHGNENFYLFFLSLSRMAFLREDSILSVFSRFDWSSGLTGWLSKMEPMLYSSSERLRKSVFILSRWIDWSTSSPSSGSSWTTRLRTQIFVRFSLEILKSYSRNQLSNIRTSVYSEIVFKVTPNIVTQRQLLYWIFLGRIVLRSRIKRYILTYVIARRHRFSTVYRKPFLYIFSYGFAKRSSLKKCL